MVAAADFRARRRADGLGASAAHRRVPGERLARFLEDEALRLERNRLACWLGRAPGSATSMFSHRPIRCCAAR